MLSRKLYGADQHRKESRPRRGRCSWDLGSIFHQNNAFSAHLKLTFRPSHWGFGGGAVVVVVVTIAGTGAVCVVVIVVIGSRHRLGGPQGPKRPLNTNFRFFKNPYEKNILDIWGRCLSFRGRVKSVFGGEFPTGWDRGRLNKEQSWDRCCLPMMDATRGKTQANALRNRNINSNI